MIFFRIKSFKGNPRGPYRRGALGPCLGCLKGNPVLGRPYLIFLRMCERWNALCQSRPEDSRAPIQLLMVEAPNGPNMRMCTKEIDVFCLDISSFNS